MQRQSPTLSSTSSDYRRSPAPGTAAAAAAAAAAAMYGGGGGHLPVTSPLPHSGPGVMPPPSPVSSVLSSSTSRLVNAIMLLLSYFVGRFAKVLSVVFSRSTPWSARQANTQSPVIMQSVKSTQVHKPVLQTATPIKPVGSTVVVGVAEPVTSSSQPQLQQLQQSTAVAASPLQPPSVGVSGDRAGVMETPPPPSYEFSIQQKQQQVSSHSDFDGHTHGFLIENTALCHAVKKPKPTCKYHLVINASNPLGCVKSEY